MREGDKQSHLISVLAPGRPAPRRIRGFIGAGLTARINLGWDLAALMTLVVFGQRLLGNGDLQPALGPLTQMALLAASVWIVVATAVHYYANSAYQSEPLDDAAMTAVVLVSVFTSLEMASLVSRSTGLMSGSLRVLVLDFAIALAVRPIFRALSRREIPSSNVLVVGAGIRGRLVAESIERANRETVLGAVAFENERPDSQGLPVLAPFDRLETVLRSTAVNKVYIAGNALKDGPAMQRAINVCEQLGVPFALPAYSFRMGRASPQHGQYLAHGYVHYTLHEPQLRMRAMKRLFDIVSSTGALWLLAPLFIAVAVAIRLTSRGPAFFRQQRVGLNGRTFNMLKFRSMVINAEELKASLTAANEQSGPVFKMRSDPRVTRIGRFIRKFSIDELPQLINVLRGDMSIVGPRPPVPGEVANYEAWQLRRLSVRPGLTCIWQVSGRSQISFDEWMYLDMQYIDHWSILQDLRLIFRTVPAVITGRGSS